MTNRLLLGKNSAGFSGMYISQSGYDVTTCGSANMIFDTRLGYYGSVVASGSATAPATITFPTMAYVPLAFVTLWNGSAVQGSQMYGYQSSNTVGGVNGPPAETQDVQIPYFTVTTNSLVIQQPSWFKGTNVPQNYMVRYIIWRCPGT